MNEIEIYSNKYNLPVSMVSSVINIESGFDKNAVSRAGAVGLMQLLPTTAKDCADRIGMNFSEEDLCKANINIELGCFYLNYLMDIFDNNIVNVLCAYNWGLGNLQDWINNGNIDSCGTIINIPIKETKNYIKKYKLSKFVYNYFYGL